MADKEPKKQDKLQEDKKLILDKDVKLWEVAKPVTINRKLISLILILIIILIILVYKYSNNKKIVNGLDSFSKGFSVINFILVIYIIYINVEHNSNNEERANRQESYKITESLWANTMKNMIEYFPETYIIYNQIDTFDDRNEEEILKDIKPNIYKMKQLNYYFSGILIQNLENFITLRKYLTTVDHISWLITFYYQFQSKIVQENWSKTYLSYSPGVNKIIQQFIDIGKKVEKENLSEENFIMLLKNIKFTN